MEFFKIRRTIPFMRYALVFNLISIVTFLAAVFFLAHRGLNFSIEFTGGTLIEVGYAAAADVERMRQGLDSAGYKEPANVDAIRRALDRAGFKSEVQNFGSSREVLIRMHLEKNQSSACSRSRTSPRSCAASNSSGRKWARSSASMAPWRCWSPPF